MASPDAKVETVLAALEPLIKHISPTDVLTAADADYSLHAETFSASQNLRPAVVFAPTSSECLAKVVGFVYKSDLNFNIRGQGYQSASASDVLISTLRLNGFEYDSANKLATIGVGNTWIEVATRMQEVDPNFSVAVARTPSVGVGGSILHGGLSWMTNEFGAISDPVNMIDAEIVKYDGTIVMASSEPDLLWAQRGAGGGFGIMTKVVLRAHLYPTDIWSGMILIPGQNLPELARRAAHFLSTPQHPRISMMLYSVPKHLLPALLDEKDLQFAKEGMVCIHAYDACGETHGREAFRWALELPGAIDRTLVTDTKGVADMQHNMSSMRGTLRRLYAVPMTLSTIDENTILRCIEWHAGIEDIDRVVHSRTILSIEGFMLRPPIGGQSLAAWPRRLDDKHYVILVTGAPANGTDEQEEQAQKIARITGDKVLGEDYDYTILPAGIDTWHDPRKTYNVHWDKLVELRMKYDPDLKFQSRIDPRLQTK